MSSFLDRLRYVFISPEIVGLVIPFAVYASFPTLYDVLVKPRKENFGFGLGATALPVGMLVFNFNQSYDMLSLKDRSKILIEWPDYSILKERVIASFVWCVIGALTCIAAVWMVAIDKLPQLGVAMMVGGILASAIATATIALARFSLREIIGED